MEPQIDVGVLVGSVRPGRRALPVAEWVVAQAAARRDARVSLVDLVDFALPVLDEERPAAWGRYEHAHTRRWAQAIGGFDAFVIVTPEYNRSIPGPLKNAIDYLYAEWHDKAAAFVSYGIDAGGARAVEQLRIVMGELRVADVREHVALSLSADWEGDAFAPQARHAQRLDRLFDQLVAWAGALRTLRAPAAAH